MRRERPTRAIQIAGVVARPTQEVRDVSVFGELGRPLGRLDRGRACERLLEERDRIAIALLLVQAQAEHEGRTRLVGERRQQRARHGLGLLRMVAGDELQRHASLIIARRRRRNLPVRALEGLGDLGWKHRLRVLSRRSRGRLAGCLGNVPRRGGLIRPVSRRIGATNDQTKHGEERKAHDPILRSKNPRGRPGFWPPAPPRTCPDMDPGE